MSSDPSDDNKNLPPWLRDVPLPPRPQTGTPPEPASAAPPAAAALPEWLRDLGDDTPAPTTPEPASTTPTALPNWLSAAPAATPPAGAAQLPDWLHDLADDGAPAAPAAPTPSADLSPSALPAWLQDTQQSSPPSSSPSEPEPPANDAPDADDAVIPDWLKGLSADIPADAVSETAEWLSAPPGPADTPILPPSDAAALPSWLGDPGSADTPTLPPSDAAALPSWLGDPGSADAVSETAEWLSAPPDPAGTPTLPPSDAAAPPAGSPAASEAETSLPGWLNDDSATSNTAPALTPFSFDEPPSEPTHATPPGPPTWLVGDVSDSAEMMPTWMKDAGAQPTEPEPPAPASAAAPADLPLWMEDRADAEAAPSPMPSEPPAAPSTPAPDLVPAEPEADDVPAWLRDAGATPAATPPPAPAEPGNLPNWLQEVPPALPPADTMPDWLHDNVPAQPAPDESVPDWLRAIQPTPPPTDSTPASAAPEHMPAWLRDTSASAAPPHVPDTAPVPDWLSNTAAPPPAEPPAAAGLPGAPEALPAWLQPAESAPPPGAADDLPPWLRDESGQPLPTAGAPGDANLPTWLRGAAAEAPAQPEAPAAPGAAGFDWFSEPAPAAAQPAASDAAELVGGVELPAWLRPTEAEPAKEEINPADARSLDWLTRLGAHEDDEADSGATTPAVRLAPPALPRRTPMQIEAIGLLEQLAAAPFPAPAAAPAAAAQSIWQRLGIERLLYLALLLVSIAALTAPPDMLGLNGAPSAPGAQQLFSQIDTLGANDIVLVGYEWDARRSGELRPLEQAVIDHLIQHKVKLVLISTDPQGSLLLYDLRDRLGAAGYKPSGEDYVLLGYKPGGELALRSMALDLPATFRSDFQGNDATTSVLDTTADRQVRLKTLGDFSMMLVLADEASDVQSWMEQVYPSAARPDGSRSPLAFLLPSETTPIVQPYLGMANIQHLAGRQGALAYQHLRSDGMPAEQIAAEISHQRLSMLAYIALFVIGALVVAIYSAATRARSRP